MRTRETVVAIVLLLAAYTALAHCAIACDLFTPSRAASALDVAAYTAALAVCRAEGREAKSYSVYETCAVEADKKYGVQP